MSDSRGRPLMSLGPSDVERAVIEACRRGHAEVVEFTVAPSQLAPPLAGHDWLIEFAEPPRAPETFVRVLDDALQRYDATYRIRRAARSGLLPPRVLEMPAGTFYRWARTTSRGAGSPVPRVTADRTVADSVLAIVAARSARPVIAIRG